jgi:enoyl-CoA hydratase/carnithine racemase
MASSRSPPSTASPSAAAASSRWPATCASPRARRSSGSPRSSSGSSPASAAPSGDPILADEAFELGLANRLVEDHELLDTALQWARKLAGQAPLAVAQIKRVSAAGDLDEGIEAEKQAFAAAFATADAKEGIAAFLGKRAPRFAGS